MMSALERGKGVTEMQMKVKRLRVKQFRIQTRGRGKKPENLADILYGCPLTYSLTAPKNERAT